MYRKQDRAQPRWAMGGMGAFIEWQSCETSSFDGNKMPVGSLEEAETMVAAFVEAADARGRHRSGRICWRSCVRAVGCCGLSNNRIVRMSLGLPQTPHRPLLEAWPDHHDLPAPTINTPPATAPIPAREHSLPQPCDRRQPAPCAPNRARACRAPPALTCR